jgi:hypothetical protein
MLLTEAVLRADGQESALPFVLINTQHASVIVPLDE